mmetsp:Transcript_96367/g.249211  ORF Transcript_96367/g.249211 Transcript_96367/m.249211 type:complete len:275 (-) Transcript_96367:215-1039(-)
MPREWIEPRVCHFRLPRENLHDPRRHARRGRHEHHQVLGLWQLVVPLLGQADIGHTFEPSLAIPQQRQRHTRVFLHCVLQVGKAGPHKDIEPLVAIHTCQDGRHQRRLVGLVTQSQVRTGLLQLDGRTPELRFLAHELGTEVHRSLFIHVRGVRVRSQLEETGHCLGVPLEDRVVDGAVVIHRPFDCRSALPEVLDLPLLRLRVEERPRPLFVILMALVFQHSIAEGLDDLDVAGARRDVDRLQVGLDRQVFFLKGLGANGLRFDLGPKFQQLL